MESLLDHVLNSFLGEYRNKEENKHITNFRDIVWELKQRDVNDKDIIEHLLDEMESYTETIQKIRIPNMDYHYSIKE